MPTPGNKNDAAARKEDKEGRAPKQPGFKLEGRLQQYEIAIAADQEGANLIVDSDGNRMTPTHATKKVKRYCYYVSAPLLAGDGLRVSAGDIEISQETELRG